MGNRRGEQSDQLGKMSWRGIHFDLKEGHLEGHLALNVASPAAGYAPSGRGRLGVDCGSLRCRVKGTRFKNQNQRNKE